MDNAKIELGLSLNNTCNLHCKMCHIWTLDEGENKLTLEKCCEIVDDLKDFDVKAVRLSGGEPLLSSWALDLVQHISQKGYPAVATTNGSMITEAFAKRIVSSGIANLNLSLDSYTHEVHDSIRGFSGSYEKIIKAIDYLFSFSDRVKIGINTVISNLNLDEVVPLTEMVQADERIDHIYLMAVMQPFGTPPDREWFLNNKFRFLWPQDKDKTRSVLGQLIRLKRNGYKINNGFAQLGTFSDYFVAPLNFIKKNKCNLGKEAVEINQLGDVYLCYYYESIGNILDESFLDIWNSDKAKQIRRKINDCRQNCNLLINCYFEDEDVQA